MAGRSAQGRMGFTTGSCAAAAAKAAAQLLCTGEEPRSVEIGLPDGTRASFPLLYVRRQDDGAVAAVRKDAGDDPDVTDGAIVEAAIFWMDNDGDHLKIANSGKQFKGNNGSANLEAGNGDVHFEAGEGVGRITKPGLSIPPGEAAINPTPRKMIEAALREVTYREIKVTLSIPGGEKLAARTFNPRLGIEGGLSILGTSGRVRPFSCPAVRTSLQYCLNVATATGVDRPVFVPGHIGARAARRHLGATEEQIIEVSNEWGFILDAAVSCPFKMIMILGHPGKLAKLAMNQWDTHSSRSPSAVPFVTDMAARVLGKELEEGNTVEGLFAALSARETKMLGDELAGAICRAIRKRTEAAWEVKVVLVNMKGDLIGRGC
ncbi:MAG: cobalt-precorrin-5B (C(1))-methyltransferase CbiD [Syntrophales bacterium]|nr:cobalt-precorrin-5B (C(1))-methyltransferase CbiD [Syntrophales bacterium]